MSLSEIEDQIRTLNVRDRAKLARRLLESLESLSESEVEALWAEEAERRLDEMERGEVDGIPADEVFRRVRSTIS